MDFVVQAYRLGDLFPDTEKYGLRAQLRRCACSIPMNIAEGHGRGTRRDYAHFISMSIGSARELDTVLELAQRLNYANEATLAPLRREIEAIERMLTRLRNRLVGDASPAAD